MILQTMFKLCLITDTRPNTWRRGLPSRLSSVRSYSSAQANHAWAAFYSLDNLHVLKSVADYERLANLSEMSRAVTPPFRRMVRRCLEQQVVIGQGNGGELELLVT